MEPDLEMVDDPDPITASYDIYIKPQLKDGQMLYILQFPNRDAQQDYSAANDSMPLEMRLKPKSGLVELDVPVDALRNYDRGKGAKWGQALIKSNQGKGSGGASHGLPGGFGIGGAQVGRVRGSARDAEEADLQEALLRDFRNSVRDGKVLTRQTLGGQTVPKENTTPQYMVGAFQNSKSTAGPHFTQDTKD
jgi:DNA-directed RNA polymerase-3 subunit RPC5